MMLVTTTFQKNDCEILDYYFSQKIIHDDFILNKKEYISNYFIWSLKLIKRNLLIKYYKHYNNK